MNEMDNYSLVKFIDLFVDLLLCYYHCYYYYDGDDYDDEYDDYLEWGNYFLLIVNLYYFYHIHC